MDYKIVAKGLGWFSIALGVLELTRTKQIAKSLDAEGHEGLIRGFGVREIVAGVGLLQSPAHSARVWNRVAGDAMDLTALGLAARRSPANKAIWGAVAFVAAATALDLWTARGLDTTSGKLIPTRA